MIFKRVLCGTRLFFKMIRMKYRYSLFALFVLLLWQGVRAQDTSGVVRWEFSGGKDVLILHGHIKDGWRLYSTTMKDDLPNSRVTLDSSARTAIEKIEEKGQLEVR